MAIASVTVGNFTYTNQGDIDPTHFVATRNEDGEDTKPTYIITHSDGSVVKISLTSGYDVGTHLFID